MPQTDERESRVRVTVSIDHDTLMVFKELAATLGVSLGRCIGDWCHDTQEGAQFVRAKMIDAKASPARVMREMHALGEAAVHAQHTSFPRPPRRTG